MAPREDPKLLVRVLLGGAVGFVLGVVAGIPFFLFILITPFVGAIFGAFLAAIAPPRVLAVFLVGYLLAGVLTGFGSLHLVQLRIGSIVSSEDTPSLGFA